MDLILMASSLAGETKSARKKHVGGLRVSVWGPEKAVQGHTTRDSKEYLRN